VPAGDHVMLVDLKQPLKQGDLIRARLRRRAGGGRGSIPAMLWNLPEDGREIVPIPEVVEVVVAAELRQYVGKTLAPVGWNRDHQSTPVALRTGHSTAKGGHRLANPGKRQRAAIDEVDGARSRHRCAKG
jgi:hypothetical protein